MRRNPTTSVRRVLVLAPYTPSLAGHHGGSRAVAGALWRMGADHEVALVHLREPGASPTLDLALEERLALVSAVEQPLGATTPTGRAAALARRVATTIGCTPIWVQECRADAFSQRVAQVCREFDPDVVQMEMPPMAQYFGSVPDGVARVLVDQDPQAAAALERWHSRRRRHSGLLTGLDARAWRRWEPKMLDQMDAVVVFTEEDRRSLAPTTKAPVSVVALGIDVPARPLDPAGSEPPSVLFFGNFSHNPNVEAGLVLLEELLPAIRDTIADLQAWVVGPDPPASIISRSGPRTEVTGRVSDLAPYLDRASVVVAPLWTGGGMRVKILETLAAGKALVATSRAIAGIDVQPGHHLLVADEPGAFCEAVTSLLLDRTKRIALAQSARQWANDAKKAEDWLPRYEELWARAAEGAARRTSGRDNDDSSQRRPTSGRSYFG